MIRIVRREGERAQRDHREAAVERGLGRQVQRPVAQVRVRVRVEADREVAVVDHRAVGVVDGEAGAAAVVVADPGVEAGVHEQRVTGVALQAGRAAPPGRPPPRRTPSRRGTGSSGRSPPRGRRGGCCCLRQRAEQVAGGLDRVVRAARSCGRTRWSTRPGARRARARRAGQPVGRLVERAVAAEHHDDLRAGGSRRPARGGCAWPRRLVSATVTSWSADSAFWITTRLRAVTDDADELTSSSTFMAAPNLPAAGLADAPGWKRPRAAVRRCPPCTSSSV